MSLERRDFLRLAGAAAAASISGAAPVRKPNFLLILADDMGFSDAGCYGGEIDTPNLDRLASRGIRFTQGYSTARCGPSRSCLLTGYYAQQTASDVMTAGNVPAYTRFIPDYLKPLGYRSYHSGKWHLRFAPCKGVGFDHSYTVLDEDRYFTPRRVELDGEALPQPKLADGFYSTTAFANQAVRFLEEHARAHRDTPFFLYFAPHSPHFPLQAPAADIEKYRDRFAEGWDVARARKFARMRRMGLVDCALPPLEPDMWTRWNTSDAELLATIGPGEVTRAVPWSTLTPAQKSFQRTKMAIHAAMITRMDFEIGKLLQQIERMGATRDTVVLFLSDNGASSEQLIRGDGHDPAAPPGSAATFLGVGPGWSSCSNTPLRLHKSWVHEGGIASPLIVHWPEGIRDRNKLRHQPCHFVDILPTLVDLAGGDVARQGVPGAPALAGRSLAETFRGSTRAVHEHLYFNHNNNRAIRAGEWKLIATGESGPWELYNLRKDRCELRNLAASEPGRVQQLAALWKEMDDGFVRQREGSPPLNRPRMT